jgi:Family of unknown function (DUF6152)
MSRRATAAMVVCLGLLGTTSLWAHHSAVLFDLSKTFTMTGTMTKLDWRNPHVGVFVDVKGDAGTIEPWEFETGAPSWFKARSLVRNDFEKAIGQRVTVEAVRAKDGTRYGYLYKLTLPDGNTMELR